MGTYRTNKVWQSNRQPATMQMIRMERDLQQAKMIDASDKLATLYGPGEDHRAAWETFWATIPDTASMSEITAACEKQYITRRAELDEQGEQEQQARDAEEREYIFSTRYEEIPY